MKYSIPVDWAAMEGVLVSVLKEDLDQLREDWVKVFELQRGFVYDADPKKDCEQISEMIQAFKKIIKYYGGQP